MPSRAALSVHNPWIRSSTWFWPRFDLLCELNRNSLLDVARPGLQWRRGFGVGGGDFDAEKGYTNKFAHNHTVTYADNTVVILSRAFYPSVRE